MLFSRHRRRRRSRGVTLVEFALVAPLFFGVMLGTLDGGLLMLTVNAANHSSGIGMITLSEEPQAPTSDLDTVNAILKSGLGSTSLAHFTDIKICKHATVQCDIWIPNSPTWTQTANGYPPNTRQVDATGVNLDYVDLTIDYYFDYFVMQGGNLKMTLTAVKQFRLEPQG